MCGTYDCLNSSWLQYKFKGALWYFRQNERHVLVVKTGALHWMSHSVAPCWTQAKCHRKHFSRAVALNAAAELYLCLRTCFSMRGFWYWNTGLTEGCSDGKELACCFYFGCNAIVYWLFLHLENGTLLNFNCFSELEFTPSIYHRWFFLKEFLSYF